METTTIVIARDFSDTPGGRYQKFGPASGEAFRDELVKHLVNGEAIEVVLDGTEGYGSSFLEEAFGGLVRLRKWPPSELKNRIHFIAHDRAYHLYAEQALRYMQEAADRL